MLCVRVVFIVVFVMRFVMWSIVMVVGSILVWIKVRWFMRVSIGMF